MTFSEIVLTSCWSHCCVGVLLGDKQLVKAVCAAGEVESEAKLPGKGTRTFERSPIEALAEELSEFYRRLQHFFSILGQKASHSSQEREIFCDCLPVGAPLSLE